MKIRTIQNHYRSLGIQTEPFAHSLIRNSHIIFIQQACMPQLRCLRKANGRESSSRPLILCMAICRSGFRIRPPILIPPVLLEVFDTVDSIDALRVLLDYKTCALFTITNSIGDEGIVFTSKQPSTVS